MANWTEEDIERVWQKGRIVQGIEPGQFRQDSCGAWIARKEHGNRNNPYGWEIDHKNPNGPDGLPNLQPLQWENNVAKGDGPPRCVVRSRGNQNVKVA
jgi:hypothetical protein